MLYYIYIFRVKKTGVILYVGSTRTIGRRINEHRRSMREDIRSQPIHKYLKANNLELITDVEISIIDVAESKQEALDKESFYFNKFNINTLNIWDAEDRSGENSSVRKPLITPDESKSFSSQREAAEYYGVSRHKIAKMVKAGELVEIDVKGKYVNESTGEVFISAYQIEKKYKVDSKRLNKLSKTGELIINGMKFKKV